MGMMYNAGWANLKPQQLKYTPKLGNDAAKLLESGESLSAVARKLKVSRPSLRNWRSRNPKLNAAFATFEAGKRKQEAERACAPFQKGRQRHCGVGSGRRVRPHPDGHKSRPEGF